MSKRNELTLYKYKKQLQKIEMKVRRVPKSIQTRVVRIVTKVKGCPYFFVIFIKLLKNNFQCLVKTLTVEV